MPLWMVAAGSACFAVLAAGSVVRALRKGVSSSFVRTYHADEEPLGYALCILSDMGIVVLASAIVLYAFGMIGNPIAAINQVMPAFLRCDQGSCMP